MANTPAPTPAVSGDTSMVTQTVTETVTETIQKVMATALSDPRSRGRHIHHRIPSIPARVVAAIAPEYARAFGSWGNENPLSARFVLASSGVYASIKMFRLSRAIYVRGRKYVREKMRLRREFYAQQEQQRALSFQQPVQSSGSDQDGQDGETNVAGGENGENGENNSQSTSQSKDKRTDPKGQSKGVDDRTSKTKDIEGSATVKSNLQPAPKDPRGSSSSTLTGPLSKERNRPSGEGSSSTSGLTSTPQAPAAPAPAYKGDFPSRNHEILNLVQRLSELGKRFQAKEVERKDYLQQTAPIRARLDLLKKEREQEKEAAKPSSAKALKSILKKSNAEPSTTKRKLSFDTKDAEEEIERAKIQRLNSPGNRGALNLSNVPLLRPSNKPTSEQSMISPVRPPPPAQGSGSGSSVVPANPMGYPPFLPPPTSVRRSRIFPPLKANPGATPTRVSTAKSTRTTTSTPLGNKGENSKTWTSPSTTKHTETHSERTETISAPAPGRRSERSTKNTNTMNLTTLSRRSVSPEKTSPKPTVRLPRASTPPKAGPKSANQKGKARATNQVEIGEEEDEA